MMSKYGLPEILWHKRLAIVLVTLLSGCALWNPADQKPLNYQCDGGQTFLLTRAATHDAARIDLSGMHFQLQAEASSEAGERYGCSVLTVFLNGDRARVEMEDKTFFQNCRLKP